MLKLFLSILTALATVAAAELYLDGFHIRNILSGRYQPDPVLEYRLKPNYFEGGRQNTNSLGFRDHEISIQKRPGFVRILALGDSFTYGATALEDAYPKQLERILRLRGKPVEVINAGMPGYGTDQEYELFRTEGLRFRPDVVILGFFIGNDVQDTATKSENVVVDGELLRRALYEEKTKSKCNTLLLWLQMVKERMQLFHLLQDYQWRVRWKWYRGREQKGSTLAEDWYLNVQSYRMQNLSMSWHKSQAASEAWAKTFRYLRQIGEICSHNNIPLLILIIPDELQVAPDIFTKVLPLSGIRAQDIKIDIAQQRLIGFLVKESIIYCDLLPAFQKENPQHSLYIEYDTHLNALGNKRAASMLAGILVSRDIVH